MNSEYKIRLFILEHDMGLDCVTDQPKSIEEFESFLYKIDSLETCIGRPSIRYYKNINPECAYKEKTVWRHKKCPKLLSSGKICTYCLTLPKMLMSVLELD